MPLYFAFGSNLSRPRLEARIPIEADLGPGRLEGWRFACNKLGADDSAKANLQPDPDAEVWGVLYALTEAALERLDLFEGGYRRISLEVRLIDGPTKPALTYVSDHCTDDLLPYDWYKSHMVKGAEEHDLPAHHIAHLRALPSRRDPRR